MQRLSHKPLVDLAWYTAAPTASFPKLSKSCGSSCSYCNTVKLKGKQANCAAFKVVVLVANNCQHGVMLHRSILKHTTLKLRIACLATSHYLQTLKMVMVVTKAYCLAKPQQ